MAYSGHWGSAALFMGVGSRKAAGRVPVDTLKNFHSSCITVEKHWNRLIIQYLEKAFHGYSKSLSSMTYFDFFVLENFWHQIIWEVGRKDTR